MINILINLSKVVIRSIFNTKKYEPEILDDDLSKILLVRTLLEDNVDFVRKNHTDINTEIYYSELKKYALELFIKLCDEEILDEEKNSKDFNLNNHRKEDIEYFNYIYENLEYPE
jgi:hypothetical protein